MKAKIKIKLDKGAAMPTRAHDSDVGYDLKAMTVEECEYGLKIDTGVHVQPEPGYYVEVVPNSRLAKKPYIYGNSIGIIDPGYTGSIKVILKPIDIVTGIIPDYSPGDTVGQLIIRRKHDAEFEEVENLEETARGNGGFGSTEKKSVTNGTL